MTLNNFLEAVAEKLVGLWPDRHVFVNEIPKDSDGNFFVGIIEATQEKKLDRRRRRHVQIEVLYFLASKDNLDFNEWSEKMLDEFESLTVVETESRSRLVRLTNVTARKDDDSRVYCLEEIKKYLVPLGLELNQKTAIFPLTQGIDFLGFRTYLTDTGKVVRKVRRESKNRIRRKLKKYRHLLDEGRIDFETILQSYSSWTGHAEHGNSYHLIRKTDDLFFNLFKNELEGLTYGKITISFACWKRRQVDEHEIQRESDQMDRGKPGHGQRPNGPGSRENDHPEML